ncbi:glycosyltransferase family 4 protein [Idiomarina seosinensis]|uniref:glycosyltransferase family 4 protein n=1 Tax=Idiomarina seosinensis TaxID=281739 RepID=UPI00384A7B6E
MKIFILASSPDSLQNFRGQLILDLVARGHKVIACAPNLLVRTDKVEWLTKHNVICLDAPFSRVGLSPVGDLKALFLLVKILRHHKPLVFISYTIKPVIWGGLAARISCIPKRVALITGLGYAFTGKAEGKRKLIQTIARTLYRISLKGMHQIFFQNPDDKNDFANYKLLPVTAKIDILNGSGVDTNIFSHSPLPDVPIRFLLIARLLGDKGIREYAAAAEIVKSKYNTVEFDLVGGLDPNPDGLVESEVKRWVDKKVLNWHGKQVDVKPFIRNCHVYVLPSYREGTPRSVIEAMSIGRAIITADSPGCRETVVDGYNGFLVSVRNVETLVEAMTKFIEEPLIITKMGQASRKLAVEKYDVHKVNAFMMTRILY